MEGNFRAGAVDSRKVHETDPTKGGLKRSAVARECIRAVDWGVKSVFMPGYYRWVGRVLFILGIVADEFVLFYFVEQIGDFLVLDLADFH